MKLAVINPLFRSLGLLRPLHKLEYFCNIVVKEALCHDL